MILGKCLWEKNPVLLLLVVEATNWMLMRTSFRVFFPNTYVGFFCEILVLEAENGHASSANAWCYFLKRKAVLGGTLLLR